MFTTRRPKEPDRTAEDGRRWGPGGRPAGSFSSGCQRQASEAAAGGPRKRATARVSIERRRKCRVCRPAGHLCAPFGGPPVDERVLSARVCEIGERIDRIERILRAAMSPKKRTSKKAAESTYDLWDEDPNPAAKLDKTEGEFHRLRQTGKLKAKPKATYVPSVLPAIEVAKAGASYNPSADDYVEYAQQIAREEDALSKSEERAKRKMQLRPGDSYITPAEARREELMGFLDSDEEDGADVKSDVEIKTEPSSDEDEKAAARARRKPKPKTQKQRRKELERRLVELERLKTKRTKQQEAEFNRVKSILKEVNKDLKERADVAAQRRRKRILRRLTATKRLGHGKFEEFAEPVLLPREIKGTLRAVKPQGNIFKERVRSFQKRNLMQPPSFKKAKARKTTLKFKVGEKRAVQEYMADEVAKLKADKVI